MPVEIKELIIRAVVSEDQQGPPGASTPQVPSADTEAIVAACVKQVLKILKQSEER